MPDARSGIAVTNEDYERPAKLLPISRWLWIEGENYRFLILIEAGLILRPGGAHG